MNPEVGIHDFFTIFSQNIFFSESVVNFGKQSMGLYENMVNPG